MDALSLADKLAALEGAGNNALLQGLIKELRRCDAGTAEDTVVFVVKALITSNHELRQAGMKCKMEHYTPPPISVKGKPLIEVFFEDAVKKS